MKTANYLIGLAATALLGSLSVAQAEHLPSPCATGEVGAGSNCMYLVLQGPAGTNTYDGGTGDRSAVGTSTLNIDVWMDFSTTDTTGGGFDILFDTAGVVSYSWAFDANFTTAPGFTFDGMSTSNGWEAIQFNSQSPNGYGDLGDDPFQLVGTLTVTGFSLDTLFNLDNSQYGTATFPSCFAPTSGSMCVPTGMYDLNVTAPVPLPAAVWMMLVGLGSLAGFSRRKS